MLYRHGDLCKLERAIDFAPHTDSLYSADPRYTKDTLCYLPAPEHAMKRYAEESKGTTGFPTRASEHKGRLYHEHLVNRLVEVVEQLSA